MKTHSTIFRLTGIAGLFCALSFTSCTPLQQQGAGVGALAGGALGALTGDDEEDITRATVIGAVVGAGAAAIREQQQQTGGYYNNSYNQPQQQQTAPVQTTSTYPYAQLTETVGYVKSPYRPYNVVDVRGIPAGKMAKEPGTENIFLIP